MTTLLRCWPATAWWLVMIDVARLEAVAAVALHAVDDEDAEIGDEVRDAADILRDQLALSVEQRGAVVADLVDHHVVGGPLQIGSHLVGDGRQRVAEHLERDGIELHRRASDLDDQLAGRGDLAGVVLEQHGGRAMLLDQRRPGNARAGAQTVAPIDLGGERLAGAAEIGRPLARRRRRAGRREARERELRPLADGGKPDVDHLHRLLGRMMRVAMFVKPVEGGADRRVRRA